MKKEISKNLFTYLCFVLLAFAGIYYGNMISGNHQSLRVSTVPDVLLLLTGVPFLFLQSKATLPDFWQSSIPHYKRFVWPALAGLLFALLDILVFKMMLHPEPYDTLPPFLQPFPYSIFVYTSGAFEVEVFYRFIPITIFLLVGNWIKKGKYLPAFFWTGAILTSLAEPILQLPDGSIWLIIYSFTTGFFMNFIQVMFYRQYGFLASLSVRLGHYLLWHILLGIYVQYVELVH